MGVFFGGELVVHWVISMQLGVNGEVFSRIRIICLSGMVEQ